MELTMPDNPTHSRELEHVAREWRRRSHLGIPISRELGEAFSTYRKLKEAERPRPKLVVPLEGEARQKHLDEVTAREKSKVKRTLGQW